MIVCLLAVLTAPVSAAHAQLPGKLSGPAPGNKMASQSISQSTGDTGQTLEDLRQKLDDVRIRHQEVRSALAGKNPPSYASFDELSARQIQLFSTRSALESWLNSLENIQKVQQAEHDLESKIQSWSGFGIDQPYPLSLTDQLASEIRSRKLELDTEQTRTTLEEDQMPGYRKAFE
jgi:hypothetical protein